MPCNLDFRKPPKAPKIFNLKDLRRRQFGTTGPPDPISRQSAPDSTTEPLQTPIITSTTQK